MKGITSQNALLVEMSKTPERSNLPYAQAEIDGLQQLLSPHITTQVMTHPTREEVLSKLQDQHIVHLACHGYSSAVDPSQSTLLLQDWQLSPLTVSDLTSLNIKLARFAYLSACQSASTRDIRLLDESITLSSAIQLSGYPSVVGTLWTVEDKSSAEIAINIYGAMLKEGEIDTQRAAQSLHRAVRTIRERSRKVPGFRKMTPDNPLIWAPYIYLGV